VRASREGPWRHPNASVTVELDRVALDVGCSSAARCGRLDGSVLTYAFVTAYQSDPWGVLGDASRRAIIERLAAGASTVTDLADVMPISRPAVSQHLKVLKDVGIVRDQVSGRHRLYSLDTERLERFRRQLDRFWSDALTELATVDEQERGAG